MLRNEHGLHARPATEFVRCVAAFQSTIKIEAKGRQYRADRVVEVLLADLNCGDTFMIEALGPDAIQAVERIALLIASLKQREEKARNARNPNRQLLD